MPLENKRIVAKAAGSCFREVAHVVSQPVPALEDNQVLVQVTHTGINGGCETFRARAEHAFSRNKDKQDFPMGAEGAGVVIACAPNVTHLAPGQPVACNSAGFQEYAVVPSRLCVPVSTASADAAALVLSGVFACVAIDFAGEVRAGQHVLITAGAGAAGSFAVQFAKAAGAHVTTTVGSAAKEATVRRLGADVVINHRTVNDLATAFKAACPEGFDLVMDGVGGCLQDAALVCLADNARVLLTGYISEYSHAGVSHSAPGRPSNKEIFWGGKVVDLGDGKVVTSNIWPKEVADIRKYRDKTFAMYAAGQLEAVVDGCKFEGLNSIPDAVEHMLSGNAIGKVVVSI